MSFETNSYEELLEKCDAVYVASVPTKHYHDVKKALEYGKNVLCESPIGMTVKQFDELYKIAKDRNLILMDGVKTAYSLAFNRMMLLIKGGIIGDVLSVDTTCTSLMKFEEEKTLSPFKWNALTWWGPVAMLPIFDILGTDYKEVLSFKKSLEANPEFDVFSKCSFVYENGVASFKVGWGVKSEGEMVISGTKGYIYVPAPWWKTDYFEVRYENPAENKRYFYQLEGEGIRNEILAFVQMINGIVSASNISYTTSRAIVSITETLSNSHYSK